MTLTRIQTQQAVLHCPVYENQEKSALELAVAASKDTSLDFRFYQLARAIPHIVGEVIKSIPNPNLPFTAEDCKEFGNKFTPVFAGLSLRRVPSLFQEAFTSTDDKGIYKSWYTTAHDWAELVAGSSNAYSFLAYGSVAVKYLPQVKLAGDVADVFSNVVELKLKWEEWSDASEYRIIAAGALRVADDKVDAARRAHDDAASQENRQALEAAEAEVVPAVLREEAFKTKAFATALQVAKIACSLLSAFTGFGLYLGAAGAIFAIASWVVKNASRVQGPNIDFVRAGGTIQGAQVRNGAVLLPA